MLVASERRRKKRHLRTKHSEETFRLPAPIVEPPSGWYPMAKATMEFGLALLLLFLTAPVILITVLLVKLTSRGPGLYAQVRVGRNGQLFTLYKIRTMVHNCEKTSGPRWATADDPRVTPIGRFLRRGHLDELPQLWNVLRGEMSLIGPRPERPEFVAQLDRAIPHYQERLRVRPGVTGLAQVQLPPDSNLASVRRKLAHDLHYVQYVSFWLDVRIAFTTACLMLGVSARWVHKFLRVPGGETVERTYRDSIDRRSAALQVQVV